MSSLPAAALAMMSRAEARRPAARIEAGITAARGPAVIGALAPAVPAVLAVLAVPAVPAVPGGRAARVGAVHSAMTGGSTRGLIAPNG